MAELGSLIIGLLMALCIAGIWATVGALVICIWDAEHHYALDERTKRAVVGGDVAGTIVSSTTFAVRRKAQLAYPLRSNTAVTKHVPSEQAHMLALFETSRKLRY